MTDQAQETLDLIKAAMVHPFERANLGKAPFRCIGTDRKVGPFRTVDAQGFTWEIGSPGQPMSSCDYCGQGIADEYWIKGADGRTFKVGSDCVAKLAKASNKASKDLGIDDPMALLALQVKRAGNKKARERAAAKGREVQAQLEVQLADETLRAQLAALPHPSPRAPHLTLLDWADFMMARAGRTGRAKVAKAIKAVGL